MSSDAVPVLRHPVFCALLVSACCAVACAGCSYAIRPPVIVAGRAFAEDRLGEITPGKSPDRVRAVLGEPFEIDGTATAVRWRYYMRVRGAEQRRLLGFIPLPDSTSLLDHEASVTFDGGRVDRVTSAASKRH